MSTNINYYYQATDSTAPIGVAPAYIDCGTTIGSGYPIIYSTWGSGYHLSNQLKESEKKKMSRGLYRVYIVDPETDEVIHDTGAIVARDEDSARLKAVQIAGGTLVKDIDDYDFVVVELGDVRAKKEVQEVRLAEKK